MIYVELVTRPIVDNVIRREQWMQYAGSFIVKSGQLVRGEKVTVAMDTDKQFYFYGLLPFQLLDNTSHEYWNCYVDRIEEEPVWKTLKTQQQE